MLVACFIMTNMQDIDLFEAPIDDEYLDIEAQAEHNENYELIEYENRVHLRIDICQL